MSDTNGIRVPSEHLPMVSSGNPQVRGEQVPQDAWMTPVVPRHPPSHATNESRATKSFRIFIADDHDVVRCGIRTLLESHPGWSVCGEARDGREAVTRVAELKPDLVVLDVAMPMLNGMDAARQILKARPGTPILILTLYESDELIRQVLEAGARGFILKSDAGQDLLLAVEALQRRATFFTARAAKMMLDGYLHRNLDPGNAVKDRLTPREREVVQLLAEGNSSKEAAVLLNLSVKTIETHRTNVMQKLDIHSIAGLVRYAVRNCIVQAA
ncbi:MAG: response regulator transcription factor [Candidatus Sulfotelmatobacter sp.]|jgi:DNA-binding NarL/FixJ family response regulator